MIGDRPGKSLVRRGPSKPLFRITCCVYWASEGSSGVLIALILPTTIDPLYCPPCLRPGAAPTGKRSFGALGTRPELSTTSEEFWTPVPLPFPTKIVSPTTAIAEGYWPVGMNPRTTLRVSVVRLSSSDPVASSTTATELLCAFATYKSSPLSANPSGLLPGGTVSDKRTLIRSISLSLEVLITETLSSFELATYKRVRDGLSNIAVGLLPTCTREVTRALAGSTTAIELSFQHETYTFVIIGLSGIRGTTATAYGYTNWSAFLRRLIRVSLREPERSSIIPRLSSRLFATNSLLPSRAIPLG